VIKDIDHNDYLTTWMKHH